jgi:hypothetical protein
VRLDHLLSKESTARASRHFVSSSGSSYVEHRLFGPSTTPTPRRLRVHVAPPGRRFRTSLFRFEGARALPASGRRVRAPRAARHPSSHELAAAVARGLYPPIVGGARPHPLVENCRASTSIKNEEIPSYKEPTVDALAPDADEGRGWLRKATGSCRPSAITRGSPNGGTRLGSCPVTPARTHRAGGGNRGN